MEKLNLTRNQKILKNMDELNIIIYLEGNKVFNIVKKIIIIVIIYYKNDDSNAAVPSKTVLPASAFFC